MKKEKVKYVLICCAILCVFLCACGAENGAQSEETQSVTASSQSAMDESTMDEDLQTEAAEGEVMEETTSDSEESEVEEQQSDEETEVQTEPEETVSAVEPLDIGEDPFSLHELLLQVNEPESDVLAFVGAESVEEEVSLLLFGESATLAVRSSDNVCSGFLLWFRESDLNQLQNAISEQFGDDGEETEAEDGSVFVWGYNGARVVLYEKEEGCIWCDG